MSRGNAHKKGGEKGDSSRPFRIGGKNCKKKKGGNNQKPKGKGNNGK